MSRDERKVFFTVAWLVVIFFFRPAASCGQGERLTADKAVGVVVPGQEMEAKTLDRAHYPRRTLTEQCQLYPQR